MRSNCFLTDLEVPSYKPFSPGVVIVAFETSIVSLVTPDLTRPNAFWKTLTSTSIFGFAV